MSRCIGGASAASAKEEVDGLPWRNRCAGTPGPRNSCGRRGRVQILARRSRSAFPTTEIELRLIAAAAIIGFKRTLNQG